MPDLSRDDYLTEEFIEKQYHSQSMAQSNLQVVHYHFFWLDL